MTELSPEAKKLLELAREGFSPADQRVTAVRSALELRIRLARGGGGGGAGPAGWAGWSASHLVGIGLVAIGLATAIAMVVARKPPESEGGRAPSTAQRVASPTSPAAPTAPSAARDAPREDQSPDDSTARAPDSRTSTDTGTDGARAARLGSERVGVVRTTRPIAGSPHPTVATNVHGPRSSRLSGAPLASTERTRPSKDGPASDPQERGNTSTAPAATSEKAETIHPSRDDSLAREIALLRSARAALDRHDPRAALAFADEYATRFASGTMRQEQLATRVLALCALQRQTEAIAAKRELERIAPRSPHLIQIRASCAARDISAEVK